MIELIIGTGVVVFLLFYFASQTDKNKHFALRLLLFSMGIALLMLVGKGVIDSTNTCVPVLNMTNSTAIGASNITTYNYATYCHDTTTSTSPKTLYRGVTWIFILYMSYVLYFFLFWLIDKAKNWLKKSRRKRK